MMEKSITDKMRVNYLAAIQANVVMALKNDASYYDIEYAVSEGIKVEHDENVYVDIHK